jgi:hypothetical protein
MLHDPLQVPTWLVVRNKHRQPLEWRRLAAGADLRAILGCETDQRITAGCARNDIGPRCTFFFCERAGERVQVGIERYDPDGPGHQAHSAPG